MNGVNTKIKGSLLTKDGFANFDTFMDSNIHLYFIMGQRGDGKTYGAVNLARTEYWNTGTPSVYVRRHASNLAPLELTELLSPFEKYTGNDSNGQYNGYDYRTRRFYPVTRQDGKVIKRGKPLFYTASLNTWQSSKGADRGRIKYFILDEAIDENQYLKNEVRAYKNVLSTFIRHREGTTVMMLANPLNPYCPYYDHYGIHIEKMEQGTITDIKYDNGEVMRFVWLPKSEDRKREKVNRLLNAGKTVHSITSGEWDVGQYRLYNPEALKACELLYSMYMLFQRQEYRISCYAVNGIPVNDDSDLEYTGIIFTVTAIVDYTEMKPDADNLLISFTDNSKPSHILLISETYDYFPKNIATDDLLEAFRSNAVFYDCNKTGAVVDQWLKIFVAKRGSVKA